MTTFVKLLGHLRKHRVLIAIVLMQKFFRFVEKEFVLTLDSRNACSVSSFSALFNIIGVFKHYAVKEIIFYDPLIIKTSDLKLFSPV